ncbi:MAG TPA: TIGR04325 family methyltransferase [Steroidobacteraceae bacterium]|nr:TIGR04325 family methyltransferase [Steroidobacteraceae bacterium]
MPGLLERFRRHQFDKQFAAHVEGGFGGNLYRGVFKTFEEAQASAPQGKPLGYDNPAAADLYLERTRRIYPSDYPVVYWLDRLFRSGLRTVFDFGGHIGLGYYAYRKYVTYPEGMRWTVHDVPAVMARGRELSQGMDPERRLSFADGVAAADGYDVFFSAGALQYLPTTLAEMLAPLARKPRALVLNLAPLHPAESFYTLQSIGAAFCPYRVLQFGAFVKSLTQLGYVQRDAWENPDKRCTIAFEPGHSIDRYYGFTFELQG